MSSSFSSSSCNANTTDLAVGQRVQVNGVAGTIRFVGTTGFALGKWVGVELDEQKGKNDGTVVGKKYFECAPGHGMFVRANQVKLLSSTSSASRPTTPRVPSRRTSSAATTRPTTPSSSTKRTPPVSDPPSPVSSSKSSTRKSSAAASAKTSPVTTRKSLTPTTANSTTIATSNYLSSSEESLPSAKKPATSTTSNTIATSSSSARRLSEMNSSVSRPSTASSYSSGLRPPSASSATTSNASNNNNNSATTTSTTSLLQRKRTSLGLVDTASVSNSDTGPTATATTTAKTSTSSSTKVNPSSTTSLPSDAPTQPSSGTTASSSRRLSTFGNSVGSTSATTNGGGTATVSGTLLLNISKTIPAPKSTTNQEEKLVKEIASLKSQIALQRQTSQDKIASLESTISDLQKNPKETASSESVSSEQTTTDQAKEIQNLKSQLINLTETNKELTLEIEKVREQNSSTGDTLELLTLDKEVAEEQTEMMKSQLELYEHHIEEMTLDLSLAKEESALLKDQLTEFKSRFYYETQNSAAQDFIVMVKENKKLKEALLKLYQFCLNQKQNYEDRLEAYKESSLLSMEYRNQILELRKQIEQKNETIEDLKASLDAALSSERLVQSLTEKNLELTDQLEEMTVAVQEMEIIIELNNAIEQAREENEFQLYKEVDTKTNQLLEVKQKLSAHEEALADYQKVVLQFRDLTTRLQYDLDQATSNEGSFSNRKRSSQSQTMLNLSLQLQSTTLEVKAKAVELELRKLDVEQSLEHLKLVQPYLPASFFKEDYISIGCVLSLRRLTFKAGLLVQFMDEKYPFTPDAQSQMQRKVFMSKSRLKQLLVQFHTFSKFSQSCSVQEFSDLGRIQEDLKTIETKMDEWIEKVKKDELVDAAIGDLERIAKHLEHLKDVHGVVSKEEVASNMVDYFASSHESIIAHLNALKYCFAMSSSSEESSDNSTAGSSGTDQVWSWLPDLLDKSNQSKVTFNRLLRQVEQIPSSKHLDLNTFKTLETIQTKLSPCMVFIERVVSSTLVYFTNQKQKDQPLSLSHCQQIAFTACEDIFGHSEMTIGSSYLEKLGECMQEAENVFRNCQDEKHLIDIANSLEHKNSLATPPHLVRAEKLKSEYLLNQDMEIQLKRVKEQNMELIKDRQVTETNMKELVMKIEMLEQKLEIARKQSETLTAKEKELDDVKQNSKLYEEAVAAIHADLEDMENENDQLRATINQLEQQICKTTPSPRAAKSRGSGGGADELSSGMMKQNSSSLSSLEGQSSRSSVDVHHGKLSGAGRDANLAQYHGLTMRLNRISQVVRFLKTENELLRGNRFVSMCHEQLLESYVHVPNEFKKSNNSNSQTHLMSLLLLQQQNSHVPLSDKKLQRMAVHHSKSISNLRQCKNELRRSLIQRRFIMAS